MIDWSPICNALMSADGISLYVHTSPDGDAIGSSLALLHALKKFGKKVEIVSEFPVPQVYSFLDGTEHVCFPETAKGYSLAVAVDCADEKRMGEKAYELFHRAAKKINIDHHETNVEYGDYNAVDGNAAAAGEMIYLLLDAMQVSLDKKIAQCLLTALSTDTGHFAYDNTTARTLRMAADLLEIYGESMGLLERRLYRTTPMKQVKLRAFVLSRLQTYFDGLLALGFVTVDEMMQFGTTGEDAEGIIDAIRDIDTVDLAIFIRQVAEGKYKVSFRSKALVDVSKLAMVFQGGGHIRAAGCTIQMNSVDEIVACIIDVFEKNFMVK